MNRRVFLTGLSGSLLAAPLAAEAQQAGKMPKIGVLTLNSPVVLPGEEFFWGRMRELGWVEGQNVVVERRGAAGDLDRIPIVAAELVKLKVDVMTVWGGGFARLARDANRTVPMCVRAGDLQAEGLVANLAKPEGNVTGVHTIQADLAGKRLEILKEVVPGLTRVGVLIADQTMTRIRILRNAEDAARTMGLPTLCAGGKPDARRFHPSLFDADKERRARIVDRQLSPFESALQAARSAGGEGPYRDNQRLSGVAATWRPHRLWTTGLRDQSSMG